MWVVRLLAVGRQRCLAMSLPQVTLELLRIRQVNWIRMRKSEMPNHMNIPGSSTFCNDFSIPAAIAQTVPLPVRHEMTAFFD